LLFGRTFVFSGNNIFALKEINESVIIEVK
jgi:hypothetical protein